MNNNTPEPFYSSGISIGIPSESDMSIEYIDNAITVDSEGNLLFTDNWIKTQKDIDGNPISFVSLKDIWTKNNGVFSKNGKLYFRDSSVNRAYSLEEILTSFLETKNKYVSGGLYWIGRTKITGDECFNIKIDINGDPNLSPNTPPVGNSPGSRVFFSDYSQFESSAGTKVFSIDRYLLTNSFSPNISAGVDGEPRWHDVPNLKIILPPIDDEKAVNIISKVSIRLSEYSGNILFRLFNETTKEVLDSVAIKGIDNTSIELQPTMTFTGTLKSYQEKYKRIDCDCPSQTRTTNVEVEPNHIIKVQFYTNEIIYNDTANFISSERRVIGIPNALTSSPINNSSIDVCVFDISKTDKVGRKSGTENFDGETEKVITFSTPFVDSSYSISLSCDKNINIYYINKKRDGFIIKAERKLTGAIDWVATKMQ